MGYINVPTSTKQLIYSYKIQKNVSDVAYNTNYYPVNRPMKHYRKQGVQTAINTYTNANKACNPTCDSNKQIGLPIKMLSKDAFGETTTCCTDTQGPIGPNGFSESNVGNVMSFSGNAKLKRAIQPNSTSYYSDTHAYLRSRGNTYATKSNFRGTPKPTPNNTYYETQEGLPECGSPSYITTVYKPNNKPFATQGSVSSSTRMIKLDYDTIRKNNATFVKPFKTTIYYSPEPVFFEKNNVNKCYNSNKCYNFTANTPARQAALFAVPGVKT
jgi:hypothetical protein